MVLTNAPWKYVWSYLTNRWQKTKTDTAYSSRTKIIKEVPQESVFGSILFDIFLNNPQTKFSIWKKETFVAMPMIQIHYAYDQNLNEVYIKLNTEKYQLLLSGNEKTWDEVWENNIWETSNVELLAIVIDNQLKFYRNDSILCSKAKIK